ncbi:hypothetical protein C8R44DRAFT_890038 [Mycena epipterygia]|nr:hypothetical protein C8R44DRAFT_890038 [Mycena epipterygia]
MAYTVDPTVFENYWGILLNEVYTGMMGVLLYGISAVLLLVAMHLLWYRKASGSRPLLILTGVMTVLATTQFSLHVVSISLALRLVQVTVQSAGGTVQGSPLEHLYLAVVLSQDVVLVTNTVITDGLLFYRCFLVWGRPSRAFLVLPFLLMLGTLATGYVTSYDEDYSDSDGPYALDPRIVFTINLFTNFVLMSLTAGRIWWVTRAQRAVLGTEFSGRYNAAIAIILESGAIYCCGLVFQVVGLSIQNSFPMVVYLSHGMIGQLVNIVPTLIVVRVGLGHTTPTSYATSVSRVPNRISQPLRFAPRDASEGDLECGDTEADVRL